MNPRATWAQKQFKYKNTSRFPSSPLPFGLALPSLWVGAGLNGKPVVLPALTCEHRVPGGQGPSAGGAVPQGLYPIIPQPGKFLSTRSDRVWSLISVHGRPGWALFRGIKGMGSCGFIAIGVLPESHPEDIPSPVNSISQGPPTPHNVDCGGFFSFLLDFTGHLLDKGGYINRLCRQ